jgi:hypothetical protein
MKTENISPAVETTLPHVSETATATAPEFKGEATYCPEDNKLRLYVGRVPREEYLKLRGEGWVALHKQRETGGGDFAATWTPSRRDTALEYAGFIGDEDQGPAERAADRAERFSGYLGKRLNEATGHADNYDAGPAAHGYQSQARAERAAARHDRIADRAGDAWNKAEYWQRRTSGVIGNALYKSAPGVRMGRIKELEKHIRASEKARAEYAGKFGEWQRIAAMADTAKQNALARQMAYYEHGDFIHPRTGKKSYLFDHARAEEGRNADPLTGAELAALWLSENKPLCAEGDWLTHYRLRLAYENQMLAAAGGMLEQCEVLPGGKLAGKLIIKVSKSSATGRATSCDVLGPKVSGYTYKTANIPGTEYAAYKFDLERIKPDAYTPPTPESLAELAAFNAAKKAGAPKSAKAPLINPTDAEAERLQTVWNDRALARFQESIFRQYGNGKNWVEYIEKNFKPSTVCRITQAVYSANSKGAHGRAEIENIGSGAIRQGKSYNAAKIAAVCQMRTTWGDGEANGGPAPRVIILTDKPQKPLPAEIWGAIVPALPAQPETVNA